jgi:hypothetical protein
MDGSTFVGLLLEELECKNKYQLSKKLSVTAPTIENWRRGELNKTVVRNALRAIRTNLIVGCIKPIVEFHPLDLLHGHKTDSFLKE